MMNGMVFGSSRKHILISRNKNKKEKTVLGQLGSKREIIGKKISFANLDNLSMADKMTIGEDSNINSDSIFKKRKSRRSIITKNENLLMTKKFPGYSLPQIGSFNQFGSKKNK